MYNVLVKDMPGFDLATFYVYSVMLKKKKESITAFRVDYK